MKDKDGKEHQVRVQGNIRSNSAEFIREALLLGLGLDFRSTWDIAAELERGDLQIIMPDYTGSSHFAVHAVYPCREFLPTKVHAFIDYLNEVYGPEPYWNKSLKRPTSGDQSSGRKKKPTAGRIAANHHHRCSRHHQPREAPPTTHAGFRHTLMRGHQRWCRYLLKSAVVKP